MGFFLAKFIVGALKSALKICSHFIKAICKNVKKTHYVNSIMTLMTGRGSHQSCSIEKGVLKNFAIFTKSTCVGATF